MLRALNTTINSILSSKSIQHFILASYRYHKHQFNIQEASYLTINWIVSHTTNWCCDNIRTYTSRTLGFSSKTVDKLKTKLVQISYKMVQKWSEMLSIWCVGMVVPPCNVVSTGNDVALQQVQLSEVWSATEILVDGWRLMVLKKAKKWSRSGQWWFWYDVVTVVGA
jgi:hypothetical protein